MRVDMNILTLLSLSSLVSISSSKPWFATDSESGLYSYWFNWTEADTDRSTSYQADWDIDFQRLEDLWEIVYDGVRGFDYGTLHQAISQELNETLSTVAQLGETVRNSVKAGGESLSTEWRKKFNQTANLLKEIKTNLKLSKLFDNAELTKQILDYSKLHQNITDELNENLATVTELGEKITNLMKAGGETLSREWRKRYNETTDLLTEIKTNIELSKLFDKKELTKQIDDFLSAWEEFSVYEAVQRSYRELSLDQNQTTNISLTDLLMSVKSSLSDSSASSYSMVSEYLASLESTPPVCGDQVLTCPDGVGKFSAQTCCSSLWLSIGAPLGLGNECWTDLDQMVDQCSLYSCYGTQDGHFNISDGCSLVPDILLNYDSCVIHDLCYITPGVTKQLCDRFMEENMNTIYCDNVNRYERSLCRMRSSVASKVLGWTDRYFLAAEFFRDDCHLADGLLSRLWKFTRTSVVQLGSSLRGSN